VPAVPPALLITPAKDSTETPSVRPTLTPAHLRPPPRGPLRTELPPCARGQATRRFPFIRALESRLGTASEPATLCRDLLGSDFRKKRQIVGMRCLFHLPFSDRARLPSEWGWQEGGRAAGAPREGDVGAGVCPRLCFAAAPGLSLCGSLRGPQFGHRHQVGLRALGCASLRQLQPLAAWPSPYLCLGFSFCPTTPAATAISMGTLLRSATHLLGSPSLLLPRALYSKPGRCPALVTGDISL